MTVTDRLPPDDPQEWLNRARSNLALAKNRIPDVYMEDLCFEAHQAAEKAIKAVMIGRGIEFPYVHDLGRLLTLLEESGETIPSGIRHADELTPYAVATRYPGTVGPITAEEYAQAVEIAEAVVSWSEEQLQSD